MIGQKDITLGEETLAKLAASDERAWSEFYRSHAPKLRSYAAHKGAVDPEDIVQEAMIRFVSAVRKSDFRAHTPREFEAYLVALVRSRVIDEYRRQKARCRDLMVELDEFAVPVQPETYHILEGREAREIHARSQSRALETWDCNARTKSIYVACVLDGRPVGDVAREFGVPPNTVSQIKRRGLKKLNALAMVA